VSSHESPLPSDEPSAPIPAQQPVELSAEQPATVAPSTRRYGYQSFIVVFLLGIILFLITVLPILPPILLGALLAAFATPLRHRIEQRFTNSRVAAAAITALIILAVLVPITIVVTLVVERLITVLSRLPELLAWLESSGGLKEYLVKHPFLERLMPADLGGQVQSTVTWIGGALPRVVASFFDVVLAFFLTMVSTYYLLRDGRWALARIERALPLEPRHTRAIVAEFELVGRAVILGTLGTAVIQGVLAGIAYWLLGVPEPLLLGALTVVVAVIPVVGSAGVWVPTAIWLAATGDVSRAFILVAVGMGVVGTVDNILRPILSREGLQFHPLLIFLALFGGIAAYGASGLYLGPLFVALFVALARIYEREVAPAATGLIEVRVPDETLSWKLAQVLGKTLRRPASERGGQKPGDKTGPKPGPKPIPPG
jgi:predicted PurR-regulated permease PerM